MFVFYLYSPRTEPIDLDDLRNDLQTLNRLFDSEITNTASGINILNYGKRRKTKNSGKLIFRKPNRRKETKRNVKKTKNKYTRKIKNANTKKK